MTSPDPAAWRAALAAWLDPPAHPSTPVVFWLARVTPKLLRALAHVPMQGRACLVVEIEDGEIKRIQPYRGDGDAAA